MRRFKVRAPARGAMLKDIMSWAWPLATDDELDRALELGRVDIDGQPEGNAAAMAPAGALVEIGVGAELRAPRAAAPRVVGQGEGWFAVMKPVDHPDAPLGVSSSTLVSWADALSVPRLVPVLPLDGEAIGVLLLATGDARARALQAALSADGSAWELRCVVPRVGQQTGRLRDPEDRHFAATFEVVETREDAHELKITTQGGKSLSLRRALALSDAPIAGDRRNGGVAHEGGLALYSSRVVIPSEGVECEAPPPEAGFWPPVPLRPPLLGRPMHTLVVSRATLKALDKGHPWILTDTETGDVGRYRPGTLVRLEDSRGRKGPRALIEGAGVVAARLWGRGDFDDLPARVGSAVGKRKLLTKEAGSPKGTDAYRLIHAEADGLPGLTVDRLGPVLRATITARTAEGFKGAAYELLKGSFKGMPLIEVIHLRDLRAGGEPSVRVVWGGDGLPAPGERVQVREGGLKFWADPYGAPATGFFPDQRDNRRALVKVARRGQRWLNLFCHTGAFSAALLKVGARVVSVDLSAPYLTWLEENLALNGLGEGHEIIRKDVRRYLKGDIGTFDGIIIDPPTFSGSGRRHWSARSDYRPLLEAALGALKPGGTLLACRNDRRRKPTMQSLMTSAAEVSRVSIRELSDAPPSADYVRMRGFPEGDAFEACRMVVGQGAWHPLMADTGSRKRGRKRSGGR